jgi:two-component system LytT family response regulator
VSEARAFLQTRPPDVVFLDVEMPGGSGLDLLESVPDATQVVFVTAREKYAVQAFAAAALDYLVKPVDPERLAETVARVRGRRAHAADAAGVGRETPQAADAGARPVALDDSVSVPLTGTTTSMLLVVGDICWIESLRNYTRAALKGPPRVMVFRRRLSDWDALLPAGPFARVGRSYLVQLASIDQIEWNSRSETRVTFGGGVEPLALGRLPAMRLREILSGTA